MAKAGWKYNGRPQSLEYVISVDQNLGRICLERGGMPLFEMSDKESVALAKKVLAANSARTSKGVT